MSKLLIIGGVAAGMSSAAKARRIDPDLEISVYTEEEYISYAGCGLPYFIGNKVEAKANLIARSVQEFANQNIKVFTQCQVTKVAPQEKKIVIQDLLTRETFEDLYDRLILATGARPFIPPLQGKDLKGIFVLRNITDSLAIKAYFDTYHPKKAVIIGGGYIGLEMVENLLEHGCEINIVERAPQIIPNMDSDMAKIVQQYLETKGVIVHTSMEVTGFSGVEKVQQIHTDHGNLEADFVLLSIGVIPNSELAANADIKLGTRSAIQVNSQMETSIPDIYAAGDCATAFHLVSKQDVYIPMGTTANKQGKIAGENATGGKAAFKGVLGTGIARVIDMEVSRTGLSERECTALGITFVSRSIQAKTTARYCQTASDIRVKLIAEAETHRLLGAQIVGYSGAAKRIDMLAVAITMKATINDLIDMDLSYSPPFSPVWDPVLVALNQF